MTAASAVARRTSGSSSWLWPSATLGIAALVCVPIVVIASRVTADSQGVFSHLARTVLAEYVLNTLALALGVGLLASVVGIGGAWLVTMCRFPGAGLFRWALLLPLAIPTYLTAYALTDLFQFAGPVQTALRDMFGWTRADYWFPNVRSLGGAIGILGLGLYPYVYLAARAAFLEQSVCVLEVSRMLGLGPWRSFARVALPLARPSLIAGLSLVLMETLAEFGAVEYCAVDTFATGIYRTWRVYGLTPAAQLSTILLAMILALLVVEARARRSARFHHTSTRYRELPSWPLRPLTAALAIAACALPIAFGFVLPAGVFAWMAITEGDARAAETFWQLGRNSVFLGALASLAAAACALVVAYGARLHPSWLVRTAARLSGMGYAIPGGVIAIGVLIFVGVFDTWVGLFATKIAGIETGRILGGTVIAMVLGYQTRFLAVSLNLLGAGLGRIRPSLDEAARTLGASPRRVLGSVHVPLLRGSLFAALLLVFVDVIKELPATLILRPFNFDTLAVRVYQLASDERLSEASTGGLAIIVLGLVPVILLSRWMDRSRPRDSRRP